MPRPGPRPLDLTLLALARHPGTPAVLLERIADRLPPVTRGSRHHHERQHLDLERTIAQIRAAACAHPALPLERAEALTGTGASRDAAAVAALMSRPDLPQDQLHALARQLRSLTDGGMVMDELATAPATPARVLLAIEPHIAAWHRWSHTQLLTHPQATTELVLAVLATRCRRAPTESPGTDSGMTTSGWQQRLGQLPATAAAAAFDTLPHPVLLLELAETHPGLLTPERLDRLVDIFGVDRLATRWCRRAFPARHPVTRLAAVLLQHADAALRAQVAAAMSTQRLRLAGATPEGALGVVAPGQRATAPVGHRGFAALSRTLSTHHGTTAALASELGYLDAAQWGVFTRLAEDFPGSLDDLLDACRGIAAPAAS